MAPKLALKIDVDTLRGCREGVPALLDILNRRGVKASFFVALGPDNSGRAVFRLFKHRGFWDKMRRTRAPALYGLKTMLYGIVIPGPLIAKAAAPLLPVLAAAGHEVGLHGYDHVHWHDSLLKMRPAAVEHQVRAAQALFTAAMARPATAFAAPGWQCSAASKKVVAKAGCRYASDTRGTGPYWPRFGDEVIPLLEIPTTLPTLDELLGFNGCRPRDFNRLILNHLRVEAPQVLTIHAEVEGGPYRREFAWLVDQALDQGVTFFRLQDWAEELLRRPQHIPVAQVLLRWIPGRAGTVACQTTKEAS